MEKFRKESLRQDASPLAPLAHIENINQKPSLAISLFGLNQLSSELLQLPLERIYIPIYALERRDLPENIGLSMPQIIWDDEWPKINEKLDLALNMGIKNILVSNISQVIPLIKKGFNVEGDMPLNILNSRTLAVYKNLGISSATLSPELMLSQVRDIKKCIPCELIAYGRLPLMITENCAVSSGGKCPGKGVHKLVDRRGFELPVVCLPRHRNMILNPDILYLADKKEELSLIGISRLRLLFTLENADQVVSVCKEYLNGAKTTPDKFTRGLYFRGVE